jgi:hypothetical protein
MHKTEKDLYTSYELAVKLHQVGFDTPVFYKTWNTHEQKMFEAYSHGVVKEAAHLIIAPMYEQVLNWLTQKGLEISTTSWTKRGTKSDIAWYYSVTKLGKACSYNCEEFDSRQDALSAAIELALKTINEK